jgi:hypothetical protein
MKSTKIAAALALSFVAVASQASGNELPFRLNGSSQTAVCAVIMEASAVPARFDYAQKMSLATQFHNRAQDLIKTSNEDHFRFNMNMATRWATRNVKDYKDFSTLANGPDPTDYVIRTNDELGARFVDLQNDCEKYAQRLKFTFLDVKIPPNSVKWDEKK